MVQEGIMLGHKISRRGIEVDKAKIDVIDKLPPLVNVNFPLQLMLKAYKVFWVMLDSISNSLKTFPKLLNHLVI